MPRALSRARRSAQLPIRIELKLCNGELQPLTRAQFEALIADAARQIEACLLETLERSGLKPDNIDRIVRTGGSAQTPCFIEMMGRIFGPDKVVLSDVFSGVTAGLAIRAQMHAQA